MKTDKAGFALSTGACRSYTTAYMDVQVLQENYANIINMLLLDNSGPISAL